MDLHNLGRKHASSKFTGELVFAIGLFWDHSFVFFNLQVRSKRKSTSTIITILSVYIASTSSMLHGCFTCFGLLSSLGCILSQLSG
mmetsp:Transcript_1994/g.2241  ORF Transcript_1994/g.2241 Transcript_1994/m.2241 type:complete len:86 (-) Transcript_1994:29-286(-)